MTNEHRIRVIEMRITASVHCYTSDGMISYWGYNPREHSVEWAKEQLIEYLKQKGLTILDK